jgi:hypothetical protein
MSFYKIIALISTFVYAVFIFTYPASYFNDDSLFLANGIENFSVIDFSPHFPGYPSIVFLGKIINFFVSNAKYSLFLLTSASAILLPPVLFLYTEKLQDEKTAFVVFMLSITTPYLMNISLSMLSESVGLLSLFLGLYFVEVKKYKLSGIILAISFFSRPSYLIFFVAGIFYLYIFKKESLKPLLSSFFSTSVLFLLFTFINNGILYFYEGVRFTEGHFSIWGRGQNSEFSWFDNIFSFVNIPYIFLPLIFFGYKKNFILLYMLFVSYLCWILAAQNPDNIRHLIPLVFIANIFLAEQLKNSNILIFLIVSFNIFNILKYDAKLSPIDQIAKNIAGTDRVVMANRSIEILRTLYNHRVADNYYSQSADYLNKENKVYVITTKRPQNIIYEKFEGRFIGEKSHYLLKN